MAEPQTRKSDGSAKAKPAAAKAKAPAKPATAKPKPKASAAPAARQPAQRRSKRTSAARTADEAARDLALFESLGALRDALADHVILTAERVTETLDDAVSRGRMLPHDAEELAQRLLGAGRRQADELRAEIEARVKR